MNTPVDTALGGGHHSQKNMMIYKASMAYKAGDYQACIGVLEQGAKQDPRNHLRYELLSKSYMKCANFQKAVENAIFCTHLRPQWYDIPFKYGIMDCIQE